MTGPVRLRDAIEDRITTLRRSLKSGTFDINANFFFSFATDNKRLAKMDHGKKRTISTKV